MNAVFKIARYAPDYPGLAGRNLTPQGPIERYHPGVEEAPGSGVLEPTVRWSAAGVVTFTGLPATGTLELYSVGGRLVRRESLARPGGSCAWDLRTTGVGRFVNGAYVCVVRGAAGEVLASEKLVIVR
jgi:hypothetical protein